MSRLPAGHDAISPCVSQAVRCRDQLRQARGTKGRYTAASRNPPSFQCLLRLGRGSNPEPHELCADSLLRVFERLAAAFPDQGARHEAGILILDGLYNPGKMRDSSSAWSIHAWAIAIDLSRSRNGDKTRWPSNATMPIEGMEFFAQEGWTPVGAIWSRDAMRFQVTAP